MSEILLYVNEELSCSVTVDDEDVTVESFWKNVFNEQVDDILNFPYKFTRLVNNKRLVVGAKQEPGMKITRCFAIKSDKKAIYLVREEVNLSAEGSSATTTTASTIIEDTSTEEPSMRAENIDVGTPAPKRCKISRQPTILDFATGQSHPQKAKSDVYSAARARKVEIFTESEIEMCTGIQKVYRAFWNKKAEEICSKSYFETFKPGEIQGAINVAWTLEKTQHLKEDMDKLHEEIGQSCNLSNVVLTKVQSSNKAIERNNKRVENAHETLSKTQKALTEERFQLFKSSNGGQRRTVIQKIEKREEELASNMTELRRAQEALRKALDRKRKLLDNLDAADDQQEKDGNLSSDSAEWESLYLAN